MVHQMMLPDAAAIPSAVKGRRFSRARLTASNSRSHHPFSDSEVYARTLLRKTSLSKSSSLTNSSFCNCSITSVTFLLLLGAVIFSFIGFLITSHFTAILMPLQETFFNDFLDNSHTRIVAGSAVGSNPSPDEIADSNKTPISVPLNVKKDKKGDTSVVSNNDQVSQIDHQTIEQPSSSTIHSKTEAHSISNQTAYLSTVEKNAVDIASFSSRTTLNYFHLHKTGGVSFKNRLYNFFLVPTRRKSNGDMLNIFDTCHTGKEVDNALGSESKWSCNLNELSNLSARQRNSIDLLIGHQYWEHGAEHLISDRDLRYFTIMRNPLHRKISFYYHFFARNAGRDEKSVAFREVADFVLGRRPPDSTLARDAGPLYYASRLLSDGVEGFTKHSFDSNSLNYSSELNHMENDEHNISAKMTSLKSDLAQKSLQRLRRRFVFIGLQSQEKASLCMLQRTTAAFAIAHGIKNLTGIDELGKPYRRMNTGSYSMTARELWDRFTEAEREEFKRVEEVDLEIYREGVIMFNEMVHRFGCVHLLEHDEDDKIAL